MRNFLKIALVIGTFLPNTSITQVKLKPSSFYYCQISNPAIVAIVESYIKRNYDSAVNTKGMVALKFPGGVEVVKHKFYITEVLKLSTLAQEVPDGYAIIKGTPVLIYGSNPSGKCSLSNFRLFYKTIAKRHLFDDTQQRKNTMADFEAMTFDPEVLEIILKGDSVISQRELSGLGNLRK